MEENRIMDQPPQSCGENELIVYDCKKESFADPAAGGGQSPSGPAAWLLRQMTPEGKCISERDTCRFCRELKEIAEAHTSQAYFHEYLLKDAKHNWRWYRVGFICPVPGEKIYVTFTDIDGEKKQEYDALTGLLNKAAFCRAAERKLKMDEQGAAAGEYAIVYFDIFRFKAVNDAYGTAEGDRLLAYIADVIRKSALEGDLAGRMGSDRFVLCTHASGKTLEVLIEKIYAAILQDRRSFQVICNAGIYVIQDSRMQVDAMIDRAILAQASIKGSYVEKYRYYTETLRKDMLSEQEIVGTMNTALTEHQFVVYYQPQYNHSTGMLVGAEALVRWKHPEQGLIPPGVFIPIFEKNGFITKLDFYVFEQNCRFLQSCMERGIALVPISTNFSRYDIFQQDFAERLEEIREKYGVPSRLLRAEITETAIAGSSQQANQVIRKLHQYGYLVEMDDFGSGYSSLNVLKDVDLDLIKLDMLFLTENPENNRGGIILSSVVRMARWLGLSVIAEGVETIDQADFLRSIGCDFIQGYLYSRPLPEKEYETLLTGTAIGMKVPERELIETLNAADFWDPRSQETLIFSNYVGGAAIFEYQNGRVEILRVNKKYVQEIGMNLSEKELICSDMLAFLDDVNRKAYLEMLDRAIQTAEEQECETWRDISSSCCGSERMCIRSNVRMIGRSGESFLFYAMIRNVTAEKEHYTAILDNERRFKVASEQVNIYYWEYTVATREMRPCFRCMRDLGLPAVLTNYPDSAIEMGVFPPEVADLYRDWHRQIARGVPSLEAVMPLTVGRVPFRVRYTTEFDENGHAVKAYGSAALVV